MGRQILPLCVKRTIYEFSMLPCQEHYFGCALDRHVWHRLVQTGLVLAILGMFYSRFLRTFMQLGWKR